jgi:protein-S-isoprenylcysteine O-methyltransferase Ste14
MEIKGRPTIHPVLFYTGKTVGYLTWIIALLAFFRIAPFHPFHGRITHMLTWIFLTAGMIFILLSLVSLGKSVRLGLPVRNTTLKTGGIYRISRNPMYIGVHLLTTASMVYTQNPVVILMGLFSFWVYHRIILGEERFLADRFGKEYLVFREKVRRYL